MDNVGYVALSRAASLERSLATTTNNIANASTDGFKAKKTMFEELVVDTKVPGALRDLSYALDRGTRVDLSEGALTATGGIYDVAMQGEGMFGFQRVDGSIALGRAGGLIRNIEGDLVTPEGHAILDLGGAPINIPEDAGAVVVGSDGTISSGDGQMIAQIGIFEAPGLELMQSLDGGMFRPREGELALNQAIGGRMVQGFIEGSNVNPIIEMSNMIRQQRDFERTMNMADTANDLRKSTIERLGRS